MSCLCGEPTLYGEDVTVMGSGEEFHTECLLRSTMGNIHHVQGRCEYIGHCNELSDKTYREEAIELADWLRAEFERNEQP